MRRVVVRPGVDARSGLSRLFFLVRVKLVIGGLKETIAFGSYPKSPWFPGQESFGSSHPAPSRPRRGRGPFEVPCACRVHLVSAFGLSGLPFTGRGRPHQGLLSCFVPSGYFGERQHIAAGLSPNPPRVTLVRGSRDLSLTSSGCSQLRSWR